MPTTNGECPVKDLDSLLQQTLGLQLKIQNVTWRPLTEPGENYGSLILAVDAIVTRDSHPEILHLVVKLPPPSDFLIDLFNSPLTFMKEMEFYRNLAPAFLELQLESGIKHDDLIRLVPRFYGGRLGLTNPNKFDEQAAIAMENLNSSGYTVRDRLQGLDQEHTELAIQELAKLHAIVIGLKLKKPQLFQTVVMPALVHGASDKAREGVQDMIRKAHDLYKSYPEAAPYLKRIDKMLQYDYGDDYRKTIPSEPWGTMVHNDFWVNNMMFKYDEKNRPINMKMVDFQFGFYDSGIKDLVFFLMSSPERHILDDHFDAMIDLYYQSFINCLISLQINVKDFPREAFDEELKRNAPTKFGQCIMMVKVIMAPRGSAPDMDAMDGFKNIGGEKETRDKLLHILHIFDTKGWLAK